MGFLEESEKYSEKIPGNNIILKLK